MRLFNSTHSPLDRALMAIGLCLLSGFGSTTFAEPHDGAEKGPANKVSFDRDVRPILSNHCWKCLPRRCIAAITHAIQQTR